MGFDLSRFIGEIDEEFQCCICKMVLENPVETPCDHLFCSECMKGWLSIDKSCPVDRQRLAKTDLKHINRSIRNLLNKLEIKCDFDSEGCSAIVQLGGLQYHITSCEYNPDTLIVCNKGCDLEISRREYQTSNCLTHLSVRHKKEIAALIQELGNQKERQRQEIRRLSNEVMQLRREKDHLEGVTSRQEREMRNLSEEVRKRQQRNQFGTSMQRQEEEISNFNERTESSLQPPMKWELNCNIKSPIDQPDVLETDDKLRWGFVRSFHALEPNNSSFKAKVLNGGWFGVGLSSKGVTNTQLGVFFEDYSYFGSMNINNLGPNCKIGDIIEVGIKFPLNFLNDGNATVEFYLSINERVVTEKLVKMPMDAVYPTIKIYGSRPKIKYFGI